MAIVWQTVHVFISSTFHDMHAERDHLVTVVLPGFRERVEQLGLEFSALRSAAKDVNGETANSWEYCWQWIDSRGAVLRLHPWPAVAARYF